MFEKTSGDTFPAMRYQRSRILALSASRQGGTLTLALRSIADANAADGSAEEALKQRQSAGVNVIRRGVETRQMTSQK